MLCIKGRTLGRLAHTRASMAAMATAEHPGFQVELYPGHPVRKMLYRWTFKALGYTRNSVYDGDEYIVKSTPNPSRVKFKVKGDYGPSSYEGTFLYEWAPAAALTIDLTTVTEERHDTDPPVRQHVVRRMTAPKADALRRCVQSAGTEEIVLNKWKAVFPPNVGVPKTNDEDEDEDDFEHAYAHDVALIASRRYVEVQREGDTCVWTVSQPISPDGDDGGTKISGGAKWRLRAEHMYMWSVDAERPDLPAARADVSDAECEVLLHFLGQWQGGSRPRRGELTKSATQHAGGGGGGGGGTATNGPRLCPLGLGFGLKVGNGNRGRFFRR